MKKIIIFLIVFIVVGGVCAIIGYLKEFGFVNPVYIDWEAHLSMFILPAIIGLITAWTAAAETE